MDDVTAVASRGFASPSHIEICVLKHIQFEINLSGVRIYCLVNSIQQEAVYSIRYFKEFIRVSLISWDKICFVWQLF